MSAYWNSSLSITVCTVTMATLCCTMYFRHLPVTTLNNDNKFMLTSREQFKVELAVMRVQGESWGWRLRLYFSFFVHFCEIPRKSTQTVLSVLTVLSLAVCLCVAPRFLDCSACVFDLHLYHTCLPDVLKIIEVLFFFFPHYKTVVSSSAQSFYSSSCFGL